MNERFSIQKILLKIQIMPILTKVRQIADLAFHYLNQPLGNTDQSAVWNPRRFWYLYKINLLEKCWLKEAASEQKAY